MCVKSAIMITLLFVALPASAQNHVYSCDVSGTVNYEQSGTKEALKPNKVDLDIEITKSDLSITIDGSSDYSLFITTSSPDWPAQNVSNKTHYGLRQEYIANNKGVSLKYTKEIFLNKISGGLSFMESIISMKDGSTRKTYFSGSCAKTKR